MTDTYVAIAPIDLSALDKAGLNTYLGQPTADYIAHCAKRAKSPQAFVNVVTISVASVEVEAPSWCYKEAWIAAYLAVVAMDRTVPNPYGCTTQVWASQVMGELARCMKREIDTGIKRSR